MDRRIRVVLRNIRRRPSLFRRHVRWFGWRGAWRVLDAELFSSRGEATVRSRRVPTPLTLRLRPSDLGIYDQVMERAEYALPMIREPRVIIDAGAHIGLTSIHFANRHPRARIFALEPASPNFELLCRNTAAYPRITPIRAALWDAATKLDMINPMGRHGAYRAQLPGATVSHPVVEQVSTTTVARILDDYNIDFVDLLKVDIEGAEKEVFGSAESWIHRVGVVIVELHDRFRRGCALSFYTATRDFDFEWYSGEHVVVARRDSVTMSQGALMRTSRGRALQAARNRPREKG